MKNSDPHPVRQVVGHFIRYLGWRTGSAGKTRTGHIRSGDTDIYYHTLGAGKPLLLLHGGLSHRLCWFAQIPWLVAAGRQLILLDTRGHGASSLGQSELSYRLLAADAVQVLNQLDIQRTDVIGWSDGANTALLLARFWPEHVERILAISANSDPAGLTPAGQADNYTASSGLNYWLKRWWTGAGQHFIELEKRVKRLWQNGPELQPEDLRRISAPTLMIIGEQDLVTPEHARTLAGLLPHARLCVIPGGGHATLITQADQVNRLIGEFLETSRPA